jgi:hypothetical protein
LDPRPTSWRPRHTPLLPRWTYLLSSCKDSSTSSRPARGNAGGDDANQLCQRQPDKHISPVHAALTNEWGNSARNPGEHTQQTKHSQKDVPRHQAPASLTSSLASPTPFSRDRRPMSPPLCILKFLLPRFPVGGAISRETERCRTRKKSR